MNSVLYRARVWLARLAARLLFLHPNEVALTPYEVVPDLEDEPDQVHVWVCPDATDEQEVDLLEAVERAHRAHFGRESRALNIVTNEAAEVSELRREEVEAYVDPWTKRTPQQRRNGR
ncbi:hypothetical protein BRD56_05375 [Thermoplasmatales archaeon SW_10_69_26]|nr:MAG: hypothetical protein BRD56_05375 [Thermoplasmatales archaeon SW_10_69_26]